MTSPVPSIFQDWFFDQGWTVRDYQRDMVEAFGAGRDTLLIAPTGGGKTLAGLLPSLIDLHAKPTGATPKLHTIYISPLRALTNDIERNLMKPIGQIGLPIKVGVRTGDTKSHVRTKQRKSPPDILLTTPESLMLLLSYDNAADYFADLKCVVVDEMHSFSTGKRGDFTALAMARLKSLAPGHVRFGLSATVASPSESAKWLGPTGSPADLIEVVGDTPPELDILVPEDKRMPLGGHNARFAVADIYETIKASNSVIVFVNTRAQAELMFQSLWQINDDNLSIGLYHGSLSRERRQKTENAIASGAMRAVVSTSALEMGIDWGDVDAILQVGAPKGVSRLLQRIGRSNHRMDEPSKATLVPCNPMEAIECAVAIEAIEDGHRDGDPFRPGAMDVAIQYLVNRACSAPLKKRQTLNEIRSAYPYRDMSKANFDALLNFAVDGGYALKTYERFHRLKPTSRGYKIASPQQARRHRMNIGTIVEYAKLKVRRFPNAASKRGRNIGEIEERFVMPLIPGDTFMFGGEILRFRGVREMAVEASPVKRKDRPKVPAYAGGAMPLSTYLADGVRRFLADEHYWRFLPEQVQDWLELQAKYSALPPATGLLAEGFFDKKSWNQGTFNLVLHTFEGRPVNNTLGLLLTRRMESARLKPVSFVITDYALCISSLEPVEDVAALLTEDILDKEFDDWVVQAPMVKKSFRKIATIAGLTEQRLPGAQRSMKSVTFSTDLIYDVLHKYEPDHILLQIARTEAERDLLDLPRLQRWLEEVQGQIQYEVLPHASPLSIPAMIQVSKNVVDGEAKDALLARASDRSLSYGEDLLETVADYVAAKAKRLD